MRLLPAVLWLAIASGCAASAANPGYRWTPYQNQNVGITLDVAQGWKTATLDDAVLVTPTENADDFAILVARTESTATAETVVRRLGVVDGVALEKMKPSKRAGEVRGGVGVVKGKSVVVRVARMSDTTGGATYVAAVIASNASSRGDTAFQHVVDTVVVTPATSRSPQVPEWAKPRPSDPDETPWRPTDESYDEYEGGEE